MTSDWEARLSGARYVSLQALAAAGLHTLPRSPITARLLLENAVRSAPPGADASDVLGNAQAILDTCAGRGEQSELLVRPTRLLLQDHSGLPVLADIASLREVLARHGVPAQTATPQLPVDLVIDHSVEAYSSGADTAQITNLRREFALNSERYRFLKWAGSQMAELRVFPPGTGIVHQVHLERLARVVMLDRNGVLAPDLVLGTDSHTPMINGLSVLGWGVGGLEAEMALLGAPVSLLAPRVTGVHVTGALRAGITATDLALTMAAVLRGRDVVGKFVEFLGPGLARLPVPHRATVANMAPEYGCTVAYFPPDELTLDYLRLTGRPAPDVQALAAYLREQRLLDGTPASPDEFCELIELDLSTVQRSVAAPHRPERRISPSDLPRAAAEALGHTPGVQCSSALPPGAIAIAAITSCTNTSNPASMISAGLLARNAVASGLSVAPWVKTVLAPGSRAVPRYLANLGLMDPLRRLGFAVAGYGCTVCIGNSGPLNKVAAEAVTRGERLTAVISGNRNFAGRIHTDVHSVVLSSPALVIAYALAGSTLVDIERDALGTDASGRPVRLVDVWPDEDEIDRAVSRISPQDFRDDDDSGSELWESLETPVGPRYDWPEASTYLVPSPFFELGQTTALTDICDARALVVAGDSVTTDDISPAGAIPPGSSAGRYLRSSGVPSSQLNSYGCRRGNHEVLVRGTFTNPRFGNLIAGSPGPGNTIHYPSGDELSVFEAAKRYAAESIPLLVLAGAAYGTGSSRDWAARGPALLGVRAVLAESFERIHRTNLVSAGISPLQFPLGRGWRSMGLTGGEPLTILGLAQADRPRATVRICAQIGGGALCEWDMTLRADTMPELDTLRAGGVLRVLARRYLRATPNFAGER